MVPIEIPSNPNCEAVEMRVFHALEPPRQLLQIRLEREPGNPQWCEIVGWTLANTPAPAWAQKVDDSGEGVAYLVRGGDAGLRLRPSPGTPDALLRKAKHRGWATGVPRAVGERPAAGHPQPWSLEDPTQRGEPFLLIADSGDLRFTTGSLRNR